MSTQDPTAFFRSLVGDWMTDDQQREDGKAGGLRAVIDHALGSANLATRSDVDALAARIAALEETVARLELRAQKPKKRKKNKA